MRVMTRADYQAARHCDRQYYAGRWSFMSAAAAFVEPVLIDTMRVLELGPYYLPIVIGADTMDMRKEPKPTIRHDARITPWPIEDGAYDLFIAFQVFEHLRPHVAIAFAEAFRIARHVIVSFPLEWPTSCVHGGITRERIARWAGRVPEVAQVANHRIMCLWES